MAQYPIAIVSKSWSEKTVTVSTHDGKRQDWYLGDGYTQTMRDLEECIDNDWTNKAWALLCHRATPIHDREDSKYGPPNWTKPPIMVVDSLSAMGEDLHARLVQKIIPAKDFTMATKSSNDVYRSSPDKIYRFTVIAANTVGDSLSYPNRKWFKDPLKAELEVAGVLQKKPGLALIMVEAKYDFAEKVETNFVRNKFRA